MKKNIIFLMFIVFLLCPLLVFAKIGVGVGTGKISVDQDLKAGGIYELPVLSVLNTGDEPSEYGVSITFHQDQPQFMPAEEWFVFQPKSFYLEPGEVEPVNIKLKLPIKTPPGEYFAYLEAQPIKGEAVEGKTRIGIAAASKLYFSVAPANVWQGIYYRLKSFYQDYSIWVKIVLIIILLSIILIYIKRNLTISVGKKKN